MVRIHLSALTPLLAGMPVFLQTGFSMPWWGWMLLFLAIILIVILLIWGSDKKDAAYDKEPDSVSFSNGLFSDDNTDPLKTSPEGIPAAAEAADDLTIIEGIGPKISEFLRRSGITTFRQLAVMDMAELDRMLTHANFELADPETWSEQASLAAKGDWKALKTLQDSLAGGRRKK